MERRGDMGSGPEGESTLDTTTNIIANTNNNNTMQDYKTLLDASRCSTLAQGTAQDIAETLRGGFQDGLSELRANLLSLSARVEPPLARRDRAMAVLQCYDSISQLVEVPQLMESLVVNGSYDDAIALHEHVRRVAAKLGGNSSVLNAIVCDVERYEALMFVRLMRSLRGESPLPASLRVVGYIRRMDVVSEVELRIAFLQRRHEHVHAKLARLADQDPFISVRSFVETYRDNIFDVVSQYKTIFPFKSRVTTKESKECKERTQVQTPKLRDRSNSFGSRDWVRNRVIASVQYEDNLDLATEKILLSYTDYTFDILRRKLLKNLPSITENTQIAALYTQCVYLSTSLRHSGVSLGPRIFELFNDSTLRNTEVVVSKGVQELKVWLNNSIHQLRTQNTNLFVNNVLNFLNALNKNRQQIEGGGGVKDTEEDMFGTSQASEGMVVAGTQVIPAPLKLVDYPILGFILNIFFAAFNQVRMLPLKEIEQPLRKFILSKLEDIRKSFEIVANKYVVPHANFIIKNFPETVAVNNSNTSGNEIELIQVKVFFEAFDKLLVPTLINGLDALFQRKPSQSVGSTTTSIVSKTADKSATSSTSDAIEEQSTAPSI